MTSIVLSFSHSVIICVLFNILTKFCIHIIIDKNYSMYAGIVKYRFSQICNRVTALVLCQNLVFAQYLENKETK